MIKVFCDRCEVEITDEIQRNLQYFIPVESDRGKDGVHLCPGCKKSFVVWYKSHVVLQTGEVVARRSECGDPTCNVGKHPGCWMTISPAIWDKCNRYEETLQNIAVWPDRDQREPGNSMAHIARKALGDAWKGER